MSTSTGTNRVNRLVIAIREEVASHEKIVELLTVHEGSIRNPAGEAFQAATLELEVELKRSAGRTARRERALAELAAELGVAPGVATIGSMVERLGADGAAVDQTDAALLHRCLPMLAPQAQLPVVPPLLVRLAPCPARHRCLGAAKKAPPPHGGAFPRHAPGRI